MITSLEMCGSVPPSDIRSLNRSEFKNYNACNVDINEKCPSANVIARSGKCPLHYPEAHQCLKQKKIVPRSVLLEPVSLFAIERNICSQILSPW